MPALLALIAVTAVWGVTFVQVKDAVAIYPLFAFLAVRFAIASCDARGSGGEARARARPHGVAAVRFSACCSPAGYALQTAGLERTTVSSTGFITGMYVVLTPLIAMLLCARRIGLGVVGRCRPVDGRAGDALRDPRGLGGAETCSCLPAPRSTRCRSF